MVDIIRELLTLYLYVVFAAVLFSWFPIRPGTALATVQRVLWQVTNPVLTPIRRMLPDMRFGGNSIDLSPIVLLVAIEIILAFLH